MAIISKPATINKDEAAVITLDKDELASLASVAGDAYFSVQSNWKKVLLHYLSDVGGQAEVLSFDATLASPTANFLVSLTARDNFEIHKILIEDFDNGRFIIDRAELTTAEFDVALSGGGGGPVSLTWTSVASPLNYNTTATSITKTGTAGWNLNVLSNETLGGNIEISFTLSAAISNIVVGFQSVVSQSDSLLGIDYGVYNDNGSLKLLHNTVSSSYSIGAIVGSYTNGTTVTLRLEGSQFSVLINSVSAFSQNATSYFAGGRVIAANYSVGASIYEQNASVQNIVFQNI